jgi:hypothetical protein
MLKNKIDEYVNGFSEGLEMSYENVQKEEAKLRAAFVDIVREAVGEMIGEMVTPKGLPLSWLKYDVRIQEEKAKAEEILNQLK